MKPALTVLAILCIHALAVWGQKEKSKSKVLDVPAYHLKAERFVEISEGEKLIYTSGLIDGFFASELFGASNESVANLQSCTKEMDTKQISAIIAKYINDHPEHWQMPVSVEAYNALNQACPGIFKRGNP